MVMGKDNEMTEDEIMAVLELTKMVLKLADELVELIPDALVDERKQIKDAIEAAKEAIK